MDPAVAAMAIVATLAAGVHAWVGTRHVVPALVRLPAFQEMLPASPLVRRSLTAVWLMGSVGILSFAAFVPVVEALEHSDRIRVFFLAVVVLMTGSPMILGSYLGLLLRSKTQRRGIWFSALLWAALAIVVVAAWHAAQPR